MDPEKNIKRNLIFFPLGTVGRDMIYNLVTSFLYTFVLFTHELTPGQLSAIAASWWPPGCSTPSTTL